jgi:hypothetical protein
VFFVATLMIGLILSFVVTGLLVWVMKGFSKRP